MKKILVSFIPLALFGSISLSSVIKLQDMLKSVLNSKQFNESINIIYDLNVEDESIQSLISPMQDLTSDYLDIANEIANFDIGGVLGVN